MADAQRQPKDQDLAALVLSPVTPFEGRDVIKTSFVVPGLAGGLRKATAFANREFRTGQTVRVLVEFEVGAIKFDPIKDTESYERVHTWHAIDVGILDGEAGAELLAEQRAVRKRLRDQALGIVNLLDDAPRSGDDEDGPIDLGDDPGDDEV